MRFIHFDEYMDSVRNKTPYSGTPEGRLTFLDQESNQAIQLSNFIFGDEEHLQPFRDEMGLDGIKCFRMILRDIPLPTQDPSELWPILENARLVQEKFRQCASACFFDEADKAHYYDYWLDKACNDAFKLHFDNALELFRAFQLLLTLNLYSVKLEQKLEMYQSGTLYFNETIPTLPSDQRVMRFKDVVLKKKSVDTTIYSKALSDGENQFLHALGLCTLYRDSDVLFLLDEPETHFNPDWRSKFISRLRDCMSGSVGNHEMLITTHSPFLISDCKRDKVLVFNKPNGMVIVSRPDYNTLGASTNKITMSTFNKEETIGGHAQEILDGLRARFEAGEDKLKIIDEINSKLGDSVEKLLLVKTIFDSIEAPG